MQPLFTKLLGLPGIDVENYHLFDDKIILEVEAHQVKAVSPLSNPEHPSASKLWVLRARFKPNGAASIVKSKSATIQVYDLWKTV
ncbi:hypothetical protein E5S67_02994 [Microcoleus sp. IPMA8]|uniref:Uncharacterized protein n=1 Tax=Microcoleus asticus IPMA8 TaxID=2563858 RepID=A0ABX2CXX3_9CYAN|nr:hypothetical protein [Microcoleus asticus IPMA8]